MGGRVHRSIAFDFSSCADKLWNQIARVDVHGEGHPTINGSRQEMGKVRAEDVHGVVTV